MPGIFESGIDDYMFPTTAQGMNETGMVLESARADETGVMESAVEKDAESRSRANAMSAVLGWIEEGDFSYTTLDETIVVMAGIEGEGEASEDDEADYNDVWKHVPDALLTLGAELDDVKELVDGPGKEADKAAARIGKQLKEEMDEIKADDDDLIAGFALGEDAILESACDEGHKGVLEATYKRRKVVRDGKVQMVMKKVSGHTKLSAAQKVALKKVRRKANTATAKLARKKSMKIRKQKGL